MSFSAARQSAESGPRVYERIFLRRNQIVRWRGSGRMSDTPRRPHPDRHQHALEDSGLDLRLSPDHRARQVWMFVEHADVSVLEASVGSRPGGPAISPRLLLAIWLDKVSGEILMCAVAYNFVRIASTLP